MNENDEIVESALRDLWPGSSVAHEGQDATEPVRARYAALPNMSDPRLLVPVDVVASRADSRRWARAAGEETRPWTEWLAAALGISPSRRRLERFEVRGGVSGLDSCLSELLGRSVTFSIRPASPLARGVPELQVFDRFGDAIARVKVGANPRAVEALRHEARALESVADRRLQLVRSPQVIGSFTWLGRPLLVLEAFPAAPWHASSARRPPVPAMEELARAYPTRDAPLEGSDWWQRQWDLTAALDPMTRGRLGRCLERTAFRATGRGLTWGAQHGDWTPSTMARRGGFVLLWNWAHFEAEAPLGLDRLHFLASRATAHRGDDPDLLLATLQSSDPDTMAPGTAAHLRGLLYLVSMATRYAGLLHEQDTPHLAARTEAMVVALEKLSGEVLEIG